MWHENRAPLYADGGTADPVPGTLRRRCGVYQPFTIETWIYNSDTNHGNAVSISFFWCADLVTA
jgi:hypothetical protein